MTQVSVLIPVHDAAGAAGLERTLESLLAQTHAGFEALVLDAAPDQSVEAARALSRQDRRFRVVGPLVGGRAAALNAGLQAAGGDWIAPLDAGDAFQEGRLDRLVRVAAARRADAAADDLDLAGPGEPAPQRYLADCLDAPILDIDLVDVLEPQAGLNGDPHFGALRPVFRAGFLTERRLRYDVSLGRWADHYFLVDVLANGGRLCLYDDAGYRRAGPVWDDLDETDVALIQRAEQRFARLHADALTPNERAARAGRMAVLENLAAAMAIRSAWRGGRLAAAAAQALRRPGALSLIRAGRADFVAT